MANDDEKKISDAEIDEILFGDRAAPSNSDEYEVDDTLQEAESVGLGAESAPDSSSSTPTPSTTESGSHDEYDYSEIPTVVGAAACYLLLGAALFAYLEVMFLRGYFNSARLRQVLPIWILFLPLIGCIWTGATGLGLLSGRKWGWWLAIFYFVLSNVSYAIGVYNMEPGVSYKFAQAAFGYEASVIMVRVCFAIHFVSLVALFTDSAFEFFGFRMLGKAKKK